MRGKETVLLINEERTIIFMERHGESMDLSQRWVFRQSYSIKTGPISANGGYLEEARNGQKDAMNDPDNVCRPWQNLSTSASKKHPHQHIDIRFKRSLR